MNKRIKELAEQSRFAMEVSNDPNSKPSWWGAGHNDTFEKFAKLIVKECVDVMKSTIDESIDLERKLGETAYWIESDIKKHFGVK